MFVKLDTDEWINLSAMERVWVDLEGVGRMIAPDGTNYKIASMQAYDEKSVIKEIQRAMTIKRKAAEG